MFNLFKKKPVIVAAVGEIRSTSSSPFLESLTVSKVADIKSGWVLYSFCDLVDGEWVARNSNYHSESMRSYLLTYSCIREGSAE